MGLNLASIVTDSAERAPERLAIRLGDAKLSYAELDDRSARLATLLREKGVEPSDRVGVMLPNVPEFPVAYYGVLRAGGVVVPMNVLLKRREIAFYLEDSGAKLLLAWHGFAGEARDGAADAGAETIEVEPAAFAATLEELGPTTGLADTDEEDTAVILYTSGTTGKPKGAELTHLNLFRNAEVSSRTTCEIAAGDIVLGALPLFHSFGQTVGMNASLRVGACLTLVPKFDPGQALETMQRDRVTHFYGVPTMFGALLHHPERESFDTSSLRNCITGGASMPVEVLRGFEDAFGAIVLEGYGLSETSPVACSNHPDMERKPGSIGTPIEGVQMQVVDEDDNPVPQGEVGEIAIRGHNIMKGYWQRPDATAEAMRGGWFHSGDMARVDEDGYFYIVDRKKDLIIRGGYNVYPREVEEVLYEHPKIREAAVVGVPHDEWGEEIGAAVVLHDGEELAPEEISAYVKERIAAYKYPRVVWFLEELPKGPTGKILKREIEVPASESV
ncbi:MAG TPA: long-chain fatty acid--CoA ligase [Solirubrobacterales bacterium]|jgi:long-chain acyl-CoA synthetase|nr:long-chain fatty acid--CoA ligase [Solirubrobacterales bacterium]